MEKFSKKKWVKFAQDTVKADARIEAQADLKPFVELMDTLYKNGSAIPPSPIGEADRMWVRVWLATKGHRPYATVMKDAQATSILAEFHKHL